MDAKNELNQSDRGHQVSPQGSHSPAALWVIFALCTAVLGTTAWYSRSFLVQKELQPTQRIGAISVLAASGAATATPAVDQKPAQPTRPESETEISVNPMEQFRADLKKTLIQDLASTYLNIPDLSRETVGIEDRTYRDSVFRFLDAAEKSQEAQRPAMLLAADFMLHALWCPSEKKQECEELRNEFAAHRMTLAPSGLAGGWFYQHDLLWRVWQDFPRTEWGERAFVLLLDLGWDTSGTCAKGSDQFKEIIHQGETFLDQYPNSAYRNYVIHLVAQAYATRWSLSQQPTAAMADYADPKLYQGDAEAARSKAIAYFEQIQYSPDTLGEYAGQFLPVLRQKQLIIDSYRFFCVFD